MGNIVKHVAAAVRVSPTRETIGTLLRVLFCAVVFWAFTIGSYSAPINAQTALILTTMLGLLITYELTIRNAPPEWVLGVLFSVPLIVVGGYGVWLYVQPPPPTGGLIPAGEPSPSFSCTEKPGPHDLLMTFGTDAVIGRGSGPFTPIIVDDCPALSLLRRGNRLSVGSFGYDANGNIAFRIKDNVYEALDTLAPLRVFRPDPSTFVLLNQYDQEVIYVRYLNRNTVRIRGHFLCGEAPQALVRDDRILAGGFMLRGAFLGSHPVAGHVCTVTDAHQPRGIVINPRRRNAPSTPPPARP